MTGKEQVVLFAKRGFSAGLFAGTSGNLSVFDTKAGSIWITASGVRYETMTPDDVMEITPDGTIKSGVHKPSSEWRMHAAIYRAYPKLGAVVHTHSPYATAFAACKLSIPEVLIEMRIFLGGDIPCAPFAVPGTEAVGEGAVPLLQNRGGCLLQNHGVLAVGETLEQAYLRAEYIEDAAKIYTIAHSVGMPIPIGERM